MIPDRAETLFRIRLTLGNDHAFFASYSRAARIRRGDLTETHLKQKGDDRGLLRESTRQLVEKRRGRAPSFTLGPLSRVTRASAQQRLIKRSNKGNAYHAVQRAVDRFNAINRAQIYDAYLEHVYHYSASNVFPINLPRCA